EAAIASAALGNPDSLSVAIDVHRAGRSPSSALGQLEIIANGLVWIRCVVLRRGRIGRIRSADGRHGGEHESHSQHEQFLPGSNARCLTEGLLYRFAYKRATIAIRGA